MRRISMLMVATTALLGSMSAQAGTSSNPLQVLSSLNLNLGRVLGSLPLLGATSGGLSSIGSLPVLGGVLSSTLTATNGGLGSLPALQGHSRFGGQGSGALPGPGGVPTIGPVGPLPGLGGQ